MSWAPSPCTCSSRTSPQSRAPSSSSRRAACRSRPHASLSCPSSAGAASWVTFPCSSWSRRPGCEPSSQSLPFVAREARMYMKFRGPHCRDMFGSECVSCSAWPRHSSGMGFTPVGPDPAAKCGRRPKAQGVGDEHTQSERGEQATKRDQSSLSPLMTTHTKPVAHPSIAGFARVSCAVSRCPRACACLRPGGVGASPVRHRLPADARVRAAMRHFHYF